MSNFRTDRRVSIEAAVELVPDGAVLALGGMTMYRRPMAFVRALLKRRSTLSNLTLLCFTAGMESDLLVGAGMVSHTRSCYFGLETFGLAPMFTQAANQGKITIIEETETSLAMGIRATMANVGFMPGSAWLGTDMLTLRPDVKTITDPYTGQELVAFPAIECNVAVLHALQADWRGNAVLNDNLGVDKDLALIADTVIVTAEEVVESLPGKIDIPGVIVEAVVEAPRGAWPTSCYPLYPIGGGEVLKYIAACNAGGFGEYISRMLADDWNAKT